MNPKTSPQDEADQFNALVEVGDSVDYREIRGEGAATRHRTRSAAYVLSGHTAVVFLEGKVGCVCTDHCEAANGPIFITDRAAIEDAFASDQDAEDAQMLRGAA